MVRLAVKVFLLLSICASLEAGKILEDVCSSKSCAEASADIRKKIDEKVQPCDDFYHFACGSYIKNTKIPDDKVIVDSFNTVGDTLKDQLKTIITSPVEEGDIEPFKMVKRLYSACMNKGEAPS